MFTTFRNAWKIADLRKKLMFTLLILFIYRIGNRIPVPGVDVAALRTFFDQTLSNTVLGFYNTLSGSAFSEATILALSIQPYINASIIIQLLTIAIPTLERMAKEEGEVGKKKLERITRYTTVGLGLLMGIAYTIMLHNYQILSANANFLNYVVTNLSTGAMKWWGATIVLVGMAALVLLIVYINDAERRIPIQYAKRVVGRKVYGGQNTNLPIKVNMSGVMPVIFAQSIASLPATIFAFTSVQKGVGFWGTLRAIFESDSWFYAFLYFILIIGFAYFYAAVQYDPMEISNNLKKNGGFIPGFRPGKPTADFIAKVIHKITFFGAIYLAIVALLPIIAGNLIPGVKALGIGGTSVIIVVGVALETVQALEAQMLMRHYKGFLE